MKRAAITGIAGQDGTYLARWLLRQGYELHGLLQFPFDREEPGLRRRYSPEDMAAVHWHTGSLEDPFSLVRFFKAARPDEVYHLAGLTDSRQSFLVPEESVLAITLGTLRLLEAVRELCPGARVFLASSARGLRRASQHAPGRKYSAPTDHPLRHRQAGRRPIRAPAPGEIRPVRLGRHSLQPRIAVCARQTISPPALPAPSPPSRPAASASCNWAT